MEDCWNQSYRRPGRTVRLNVDLDLKKKAARLMMQQCTRCFSAMCMSPVMSQNDYLRQRPSDRWMSTHPSQTGTETASFMSLTQYSLSSK